MKTKVLRALTMSLFLALAAPALAWHGVTSSTAYCNGDGTATFTFEIDSWDILHPGVVVTRLGTSNTPAIFLETLSGVTSDFLDWSISWPDSPEIGGGTIAASVASVCPTPIPTATATSTNTLTPTETPTLTPTLADTPTQTPTDTPTSSPTETSTNTPTSTLIVVADCALIVTKHHKGGGAFYPGARVRYLVSVKNLSGVPQSDIVAVDYVPPEVVFKSLAPKTLSLPYDATNDTASWKPFDLKSGKVKKLKLKAVVRDDAIPGTMVTNAVVVTDDKGKECVATDSFMVIEKPDDGGGGDGGPHSPNSCIINTQPYIRPGSESLTYTGRWSASEVGTTFTLYLPAEVHVKSANNVFPKPTVWQGSMLFWDNLPPEGIVRATTVVDEGLPVGYQMTAFATVVFPDGTVIDGSQITEIRLDSQ